MSEGMRKERGALGNDRELWLLGKRSIARIKERMTLRKEMCIGMELVEDKEK